MNCPNCGSDDVMDQGFTNDNPPRVYMACDECQHEWLVDQNQENTP